MFGSGFLGVVCCLFVCLMVQLMNSGNLRAEPETTSSSSSSQHGNKVPVKLEIVEDPLEEEYGPLNKRSKPSQTIQPVKQ